jgi:hypothetical protein
MDYWKDVLPEDIRSKVEEYILLEISSISSPNEMIWYDYDDFFYWNWNSPFRKLGYRRINKSYLLIYPEVIQGYRVRVVGRDDDARQKSSGCALM